MRKAFLASAAIFLLYPLRDSTIQIHFNEKEMLNHTIVSLCPSLVAGTFSPTVFMGHGLLQTYWGGEKSWD
jgi:hypothetical protein